MALLDARGKQAIRMKTQQRGNTLHTTAYGKGTLQAVINQGVVADLGVRRGDTRDQPGITHYSWLRSPALISGEVMRKLSCTRLAWTRCHDTSLRQLVCNFV